ncbi:MAG: ASCH domain-containing protein [Nanoarchaeota archaeon]
MDHIAILSKQSKLLDKILSGKKTIESRWSKHKIAPFGRISAGDTIYLRETGSPVVGKARAGRVEFYQDLTDERIEKLLKQYGTQLGVGIEYAKQLRGRLYCTLIHLTNIERITPFKVNKAGYAIASGWMIVKNINTVKL